MHMYEGSSYFTPAVDVSVMKFTIFVEPQLLFLLSFGNIACSWM